MHIKAIFEKKTLFTSKISIMCIAVICTFLWGNMIPAIQAAFNLFGIKQNDMASEIFFAGICFTLSGIITLFITCVKSKRIVVPNKNIFWNTVLLGLVR